MTEFNAPTPPEDDDDFPPAYRELVEPTNPSPKLVREWAIAQGLSVGKRGRIPADITLAYQRAQRS